MAYHLIAPLKRFDRIIAGGSLVRPLRPRNKTSDRATGNKKVHQDQRNGLMSGSQVKTICFFDHKGIAHFEFIEQGRTVKQHPPYLPNLVLRDLSKK